MPQLLSRILLGALLPPLAVMFDVICHMMIDRLLPTDDTFWIANLSTALFVMIYWCALWRKLVMWTAWRTVLTGTTLAPAWIAGMIAKRYVEDRLWVPIGIPVAMIVATLLWMFGTAFIWRESKCERLMRVGEG